MLPHETIALAKQAMRAEGQQPTTNYLKICAWTPRHAPTYATTLPVWANCTVILVSKLRFIPRNSVCNLTTLNSERLPVVTYWLALPIVVEAFLEFDVIMSLLRLVAI
eukprot:scaffold1318_cov388-Prasinococcus_capsulatus_cf.AAC.51